jgi:hypothetical protein
MGSSKTAEAAARLRHDLGKYIRFSAPETRETDTDALRQRLRADVVTTRRTAAGARSAAQVFEQWRSEEAELFPAGGALAEMVERLGRTIEEIRWLCAEIGSLDRPGLERLDALTLTVAKECRALALAAKE